MKGRVTRGGALAAVVGLGATLFAGIAVGQGYIGAERCGSCHPFAYQRWKQGPHASAHLSLSQAQLEDPKCNTCHTMAPDSQDVGLLGIQCERCHGAGRYYHPRYVMKDSELSRAVGLVDPEARHCQQCHTEGAPSIKAFDFATLWGRVDHGKSSRQAWEAERAMTASESASVGGK